MRKVQTKAITALLETKDRKVFLELGEKNLTKGLRVAAELIRTYGIKEAAELAESEKLGLR